MGSARTWDRAWVGLIARAEPDSLWQMLILAGALDVVPMRGEFLAYEVPTYFGMLCAAYERISV